MLTSLIPFFIHDTYCYTQLVVDQVYISIPLLLYSHLPTAIISIVVGVFLLTQTKSLEARIFFFLSLAFFAFTIGDLIEWFVFFGRGSAMFARSVLELADPAIFILASYFLYTLVKKKDAPLFIKIIWVGLWIPEFVMVLLGHNLTGYNWGICESVENTLLTNYVFYIDSFYVLTALLFSIKEVIWAEKGTRRRVLLETSAVCFFIALFFITEYVLTGYLFGAAFDYNYFVYAFFGMPILIAFLAYLTIRFKIFSTKLITAQILVFGIVALVFSQFFFLTKFTSLVLNIITLALTVVIGFDLIRNVKREIEQRQRIELLAQDLEKANKQQIILIHFITHQIKGFLTKSRNIFSVLMEGDVCALPDQMKPMIEEGFRSDTKGVETVQEILNAANIKNGKVSYTMEPFDLRTLTEDIVHDLKPAADKKQLSLITELGEPLTVTGDRGQLLNAIKNLIDNSIKYTPQGSVKVSLTHEGSLARLTVQDTGVGITPDDMLHLFTEGGHGKDSQKVNVESTGFGLYIVKNIIEAHKGKVWAESEGEGKGSRFIIELPIEG